MKSHWAAVLLLLTVACATTSSPIAIVPHGLSAGQRAQVVSRLRADLDALCPNNGCNVTDYFFSCSCQYAGRNGGWPVHNQHTVNYSDVAEVSTTPGWNYPGYEIMLRDGTDISYNYPYGDRSQNWEAANRIVQDIATLASNPTGSEQSSTCLDTCRYAHDGECDDGGSGSLYNVCTYGTDCTDCGPR